MFSSGKFQKELNCKTAEDSHASYEVRSDDAVNANNYGDDGGGTGGAFSGEQFVLLVVAVTNPYVVF